MPFTNILHVPCFYGRNRFYLVTKWGVIVVRRSVNRPLASSTFLGH